MTETTPLDAARAAMDRAPEDAPARLAFYRTLAASELFLLLSREPEGDETVEPEVFPVENARYVLAFDREDRLTAFTGAAAPYAALSGRGLAGMLAGQGLGLGLNLSVAPSETLLPAEAVDWLAETLGADPDQVEDHPETLDAPRGLPDRLLTGLDAGLAAAGGRARCAYLAAVGYRGGGRGHMLAFIDAAPGAEPALTRIVGEALTFSGIEAGTLDVAFFAPSDPIAARLARVGLRFDLPQAGTPPASAPKPPGSDPDAPPILR
ncbi:SseB family protein [Rhodovulum sp. YNF3179]|uniref:SseB family protein n=1 Tax=Rhodovulum sp. YNF3179 TaxID=3425127 RepID=UPI003D327F7D